MCGDVDDR